MGQDDPNKPSTHILIDGRRRSWMSDGGNMLSTGARWSRRVARDCCRPRDRRAPPSRRHTDHDRPEWTSPVPSGTSVVDARHPPPQPTIEPSCLAFVRAKKFRYRLGVTTPIADKPILPPDGWSALTRTAIQMRFRPFPPPARPAGAPRPTRAPRPVPPTPSPARTPSFLAGRCL